MTHPTVFDPTVYDLPIPTIDGLKADRIAIVISGRIELDRTNADHLETITSLQLGRTITLTCEAICTGKPSTYRPSEDGPGTVGYQATLRITDANFA